MPSYPIAIIRCQHIRVNGTQCGSPALRLEKHCFYHMRFHGKSLEINLNVQERGMITLPILEDANSIQAGLAEMLRLLATNQIEHKTAALMLYALQTAAANVRLTSFEPEPTRVVIDRESVERRPIGASAWSAVEGREYDELAQNDTPNEKFCQESNLKISERSESKISKPKSEQQLADEARMERYVKSLDRAMLAEARAKSQASAAVVGEQSISENNQTVK
jgi:hypothetical protein